MSNPIPILIERVKPLWIRARQRAENLAERFQLLSTREKRALIAAAAILGVFLLDFVIVRPWLNNLRQLGEKIAVQEKQTLHHLRSVAQKSSVDSIYAQVWQSLDLSETTDDQIRAGLLRDVEELARGNNLYLSEVKPQVSSEDKEFKIYSVRIQADGNLENLGLYFADLIKKRKLYFIESFRITPHPEDLNKIRATVVVSRSIFRDRASL